MQKFEIPLKSQRAIQILTLDYLIDGTIDGNTQNTALRLIQGDFSNFRLTSVRFQPTGTLNTPIRTAVPWALIYGNDLVAVIPRDEASTELAKKLNGEFRYPVPAEVYVGSYLIRGTVMSTSRDIMNLASYSGFVVIDAEIKSLLPAAQMSDLTAPYVLVVGQHKHAILPTG